MGACPEYPHLPCRQQPDHDDRRAAAAADRPGRHPRHVQRLRQGGRGARPRHRRPGVRLRLPGGHFYLTSVYR